MSGEVNKCWENITNHNLLIVWKPEYNLGIHIIDEQHRGIVAIINTLHFGMQHKRGIKLLKPVIEMVYDYSQTHFEMEEDFLKKCKYPDLDNHLALHRSLLQDQKKMAKESIGNNDEMKFMNFLKHWWISHICEKDMAFKNYLMKLS